MKKINHVLNQKIIKKSLTNLILKEQSETEKFIGFEEVPNNSDALKFKSTSAPNMKAALDKANIPTDKRSEYFMIKSHYDSFTKEEKLGKTGKELGISKDNDPYTYDDLGGGKYKVISGPVAKVIGKVFSMPKKSTSDSERKKMPPSEFFGTFGPIVKSAARGTDVFPSVTLAQAAIETGWGKSTVGDANNMFGIKAKGKTNQYWTGDAVKKSTTEYYDGVKGQYNLAFRKYNSLKDSILDHNLFLKVNKRYSDALKATTPESQARLIHKAGYATDPNYSDKIISMIKKYNLKQYDDEILAAKSKDSTTTALAENSSKRKKMILGEEKLRKIIRHVLMEATEKFEDYIKDQKSGNDFRAWVNKNKPDIAKKHDLDETGSFNNSYIKNTWEDVGDEYAKEKKAEIQKKKNLDTGGKMIMAQGDGEGEPGTYSAGRGMENRYYKFYIDDIVVAVDELTGKMGQLKRGVGSNFEITPINESVRRIRNYLFKENYINPAKVYTDIKRGNYEAPGEAGESIKNNVEFQQKIADKEKKLSKSTSTKSVKDNSSKPSKAVDPKEHAFIDEDSLPIKFEQLDMSAGAAEGEKLLSQISGFGEKSEEGLKKINDIVVKQAITNHGDGKTALMHPDTLKPVNIKDSWKYLNRVAWSGHTFNAIVTPSHPAYNIVNSVPKQMGISYPWAQLMVKRQEVENNPESFIGQVVLLPFTREEVETRSDLKLLDGVFSLNGYSSKRGLPSGCGLKTFKKFAGSEAQSGAHMNVYSGGKLIGGNLGNDSPTGGTMQKISISRSHTVFFILVKILPNKAALA